MEKFLWILAPIVTAFAMVRSLLLYSIRLKQQFGTSLIEIIRQRGRTFVLSEEITDEPLPRNMSAFCWVARMPIFFSIEERLMQGGGGSAIDLVISVRGLKWQKRKLVELIRSGLVVENVVPIYILQEWDAERIWHIEIPQEISAPYIEEEIGKEI